MNEKGILTEISKAREFKSGKLKGQKYFTIKIQHSEKGLLRINIPKFVDWKLKDKFVSVEGYRGDDYVDSLGETVTSYWGDTVVLATGEADQERAHHSTPPEVAKQVKEKQGVLGNDWDRQVLIVRQSCLKCAVELVKDDNNIEGKDKPVAVKSIARNLVDWVLEKPIPFEENK